MSFHGNNDCCIDAFRQNTTKTTRTSRQNLGVFSRCTQHTVYKPSNYTSVLRNSHWHWHLMMKIIGAFRLRTNPFRRVFFLKPTWLLLLHLLATMRAWITVLHCFSLIHFVHALDSSSAGLASSSSNYGTSSTTATSTVPTGSLPGNVSLTPTASGPSTETQVIIPITPATFSPFPVPSDKPVPPNYPAVDPSQPPSVRYTGLLSWLLLELTRSNHIFLGGLFSSSRFRTCVGSRIR